MTRREAATLSAVMPAAAWAQQQVRPEFQPVDDDPALPRVLILGDSISIGYTLPLRRALQGVANVHRPPENCAHTWKGLEKIDEWLGAGKWDVIHFNWGLHDLKYVDADGKLAMPPDGEQVSTTDEYAANLEKLVARLEKTGAKLIWRVTTRVPEGAAGRKPADLPRYNDAAAAVMRLRGIEVDDMNAFIHRELDRIGLGHDTFTGPAIDLIVRSADGVLRKARNLCLACMLQAVRASNKTIDIDNVNRVLLQPHWHKEIDLTDF